MNCPETRDHLPALVYGDLDPTQSVRVEAHLETCPSCRNERAALARLRQTLDAVPTPAFAVDVAAIYRHEAENQRRRLRRWRRLAVAAVTTAAAAVVLAAGPRLEIRLDAHQVVFRWGTPAPAPPVPPSMATPAPRELPESPSLASLLDQVQVLGELVQGLRDEGDTRNQRHREILARLQSQIDELREQVARRSDVLEADLAALSARSPQPEKGTLP